LFHVRQAPRHEVLTDRVPAFRLFSHAERSRLDDCVEVGTKAYQRFAHLVMGVGMIPLAKL
jgi:hypothetical protein